MICVEKSSAGKVEVRGIYAAPNVAETRAQRCLLNIISEYSMIELLGMVALLEVFSLASRLIPSASRAQVGRVC